MKKILKIFLIMIMFMAMPVFAEEQQNITKESETIISEETVKEPIIIKSVQAETKDKKVQLRETEGLDIVFNELNQTATYTVKLENTSDEVLYVNDLEVENLSEEFISFSLSPNSVNAKIEPGKSKDIEVIVKTLDISQAGRNVSDDITLKFILSREVVKNPETSSNWIVYLILITTLLITFSTMFSKVNKKKKLSLIMIGLLCGTIVVSADNAITVSLTGKVTYISQNLMQTSGTKLDGYKISYAESHDVWKHAEQVKNIIIVDSKIELENIKYQYDLTSTNNKKVIGYLVKNDDKKVDFDLYIVANGVIYAPEDATGLFSFPNVEKIQGLEYVEFENTTNMTAMFMNNEKLTSVNTKAIDTSNVTNTSYMFNRCDKLNVSESDFVLSSDVNKQYMFNTKLINIVIENSISDKNIDFNRPASSTNGQGIYYKETTKKSQNPIYYYRGLVDNNIIFANKCWKIVRTTETGGIKIIYNGLPTNGSCNNTGVSAGIGTYSFNQERTSITDVGYMYDKRNPYKIKNISVQSEAYKYGKSVVYSKGKYTLTDTITSNSWSTAKEKVNSGYRYTCFNSNGVCDTVMYIVDGTGNEWAYLQELDGFEDINDYLEKLFPYSTDDSNTSSKMKTFIESWFKNNLETYVTKLEDAVWCNDRTIFEKGTWNPLRNGIYDNDYIWFTGIKEQKSKLDSKCENPNDRFTVESKNGNGKLTYPVGLLTAEEANMAGVTSEESSSHYLYSGKWTWTMTPSHYNSIRAYNYIIGSGGKLSSSGTDEAGLVRPVISLKQNVKCISGTGTEKAPYVVE